MDEAFDNQSTSDRLNWGQLLTGVFGTVKTLSNDSITKAQIRADASLGVADRQFIGSNELIERGKTTRTYVIGGIIFIALLLMGLVLIPRMKGPA